VSVERPGSCDNDEPMIPEKETIEEGSASADGRSETFRDSLGIVNDEGKRRWIYPKQPGGRYYRWRTALSLLFLAILFGSPFVKIEGHPLFLFDITQRKFILFGQIFGPHDFYLFGLLLITGVVFIILFTVAFGRIFCGWVCPQTVFMEMVFRRVDYWIEGDHRQQQRLRRSEWTGEKILKKGTKYILYLVLSFLVGNMLLAWVIGIDKLSTIVTDQPSRHIGGLTAMLGFTVLFYWIFAWFREQACILVCPYGRLQGVLLDKNSIVIAYDHLRGEPRGKIRRDEQRTKGDCIDCDLCVDVCPTGIDIRNGTQLECVNCTACIDACDGVMDKIRKPRGLIRYDSADNILNRTGFRWTPRIIGYSAVLVVLLSALGFLGTTRTEFDVTILRSPGMFFQEMPNNMVSNIYDLKLLNKTFTPVPLTLKLLQPRGEILLVGEALTIQPQETREGKLMVLLPRDEIQTMSTPVRIGVFDGQKQVEVIETSFLGPVRKK
jgi:cytochrome c oxidase accessory protein FixG